MVLEKEDITQAVIGAAFDVHNELGYGFLEKVYYKGSIVGDYRADIVVDGVIVELKVSAKYNPQDEAQLLNELKATRSRIGLLVNLGREKVEFKRFIASA